jgi:hypothetical protein
VNFLIIPDADSDADSGKISGMQNQTAKLTDELVSPIAAEKRAYNATKLSNRNIKGLTKRLTPHLWLTRRDSPPSS